MKFALTLLLSLSCATGCAPKDTDRPLAPPVKTAPAAVKTAPAATSPSHAKKAPKEPAKLPVAHVSFRSETGQPIRVVAEVAETPDSRRIGLMHRKTLPENGGMLFIFPKTAIQAFWMKNTLIPLDMIFLNEGYEIVGIVHEATPHSLQPRSVGKPCRYVLEVNGGWSKKRGIKVGDRVEVTRQ